MAKYNNPEWIGKRFGMVTVLEPITHMEKRGKNWYWKIRCDCGCEKEMKPHDLITGRAVSCGCYRKSGNQVLVRHNESHTPLHNIWCGMNKRCNPNKKSCKNYGDRGIKVCEEWSEYEAFANWARENGYREGLSIERIDVNGDYCPDNCTWIPMEKQARNRRTTHWVEYRGERMSLAEACERANLPYKQVFERIVKRKWPVDLALSVPMGSGKREKHT